jgi:hypothetical protein
MTNQRFILALLSGCLLSVFFAGIWLRGASRREAAPRKPTIARPTATPTQPVVSAPPGARLAGTVVGDARYAVIELPDGTNDLFRPGQEVPGLGRLVEVENNRATFDGPSGRIEMKLVPAATTTPVILLRDTPPTAEVTRTPLPPSPSAS